jgi:hypothetical protein
LFCAAILRELNNEKRYREEQQDMHRAAFMQRKLQDEPRDEQPAAGNPEHIRNFRARFTARFIVSHRGNVVEPWPWEIRWPAGRFEKRHSKLAELPSEGAHSPALEIAVK